jgi:hypothetical protein
VADYDVLVRGAACDLYLYLYLYLSISIRSPFRQDEEVVGGKRRAAGGQSGLAGAQFELAGGRFALGASQLAGLIQQVALSSRRSKGRRAGCRSRRRSRSHWRLALICARSCRQHACGTNGTNGANGTNGVQVGRGPSTKH